ncbi:GTPase [Moellerella wisconsensis]|uniref:GTPase n=3 Tax=Moellerella wisconsensis TaxID=158849 RepID=A0ACD3Y5I2_9GAMM|nr:GTPase [Moellerella wisconsensis]KLN96038.1 GTP-binding protein [Moellerella wisconsensis]KPD03298.1 putative metal chaperone/GTPase [Moellerella wisconsensis ATCC 35017]UNH23617.1 GTPase [Moellerella wisconsensis]UNH30189.1 GTPase [Moellerella wisconsensis]UNH38348.1 GTPase [Moellerella wisconsensis]
MKPISVTILTGFLGAGKTTLLRHILNEQHGYKIAVIENEFGEVPIDDELIGDRATQIKTLSNGCICCSRSSELEDALLDLLDSVDSGKIEFDRLLIECTGMADPGPITQTFFSHETLCERFLLDGIITLVDAVHAEKQLNDFAIAQAQIGYADRILLTKTDINSDNTVLIERLQRINARAPVYSVTHGAIDVGLLFDVQGFILNDQLNISQPKLRFVPKQQNEVQSIVVELDYPVELMAVSQVMEELLLSFADNLLRYKGILSIVDQPCRLLFQGVQRLYSADWDREWQENEPRNSVMVFIGVSLPESLIRQKFASLKLAEH